MIQAHRLACLKLHTFNGSRFFKLKFSGIQETHILGQAESFMSKIRSFGNTTYRLANRSGVRVTTAFGSVISAFGIGIQETTTVFQIQNLSTNGIMKWKIGCASNGEPTSIYSLPFYTADQGYRMCLRLDINGYGEGFNSHMSLFIVIMKGEFDDQLTWPASLTATFKLLNMQSGTDTIATCKPILARPSSAEWDSGGLAGFSQFIGQQYVQNFILDDTFFITCEVTERVK